MNQEPKDASPSMLPELEYLARDIGSIQQAILKDEVLLRALGDIEKLPRHTLMKVALDLLGQVLAHGMGIVVLCPIAPPTYIVSRAFWESVATTRYLCRHPDREREAAIFEAYGLLKDKEDFHDDPALVAERDVLLRARDQSVVAEAARRIRNRPHSPTGLSIRDVAAKAGISGFDRLYGALSGRVHPHRTGKLLRFDPAEGNQQVFALGEELSEAETVQVANGVRRGLRAAAQSVTEMLPSDRIGYGTPAPDQRRMPNQ